MLPVLSRCDIDNIAEEFLREFQPETLTVPQSTDIDGFLESCLGATPDYQYLSHNMVYLGMTVFEDTNSIPIFNPQTGRAEFFSAKADTMLFDNRLLEANQEHRYRFTAGHECGHFALHRAYYKHQSVFRKFLGLDDNTFAECYYTDLKKGKRKLKTDVDWLEWQANQFSGSILMPRKAVILLSEKRPNTKTGYFQLISDMEIVFNVSSDAAVNRMKNLKII